MPDKEMITKKKWEEFKESGMLWLVNTTLHIFGYSIVFSYNENGEIEEVYPARVRFRGFSKKTNTEGIRKVNKYLKENIEELDKEANE